MKLLVLIVFVLASKIFGYFKKESNKYVADHEKWKDEQTKFQKKIEKDFGYVNKY